MTFEAVWVLRAPDSTRVLGWDLVDISVGPKEAGPELTARAGI